MTLAYLQYLSYPEIRLVLTLIAAALSAFGFFWNIPRISRALHWLDHRKILCGCLIFILSFAITALLALERGLPLPFVHDEFSYLLQADTFAQGRLSNPTPPASDHFETMHLLVRPTYQSKYPPGQAIFMAMGQVFFGQPIVGVWLSTALAAAALWWAVRAFVPGKWAFLGALIACAHPQVFEWGEQYWGGNVALLAGALLTGAMGRFSKYPSPKLAAIAGLGAFLLSITRPYEGLVITLLLGLLTLLFLRKSHIPYRSILKAVAAFFLVFVPGMLWLGYYNFRVTGHALRLPYMEHQSQYGAAPLFIFQPIKPESLFPKYNNPQLLQFAKDSNAKHLQAKTFSSLLNKWSDELVIMEQTFFGNIEGICILLLFLPVAFKHDKRLRWMAIALVAFGGMLLLETFMFGHYMAPAGALMLALTLRSGFWMWKKGGKGGQLMIRAGIAAAAISCAFSWIGFYEWIYKPANWRETLTPWYVWRDSVANDFLAKKEGKQLLIVRYAPDHNVNNEWVYNKSDLQNEKIIFARDLGAAKNQQLLDAFKDRTPWIIEPDNDAKPDPWRYVP